MSSPAASRYRAAEDRYEAILLEMADPDLARSPGRLREISQAQAELEPLIRLIRELARVERELADARALVAGEDDDATGPDPELRALAGAECEALAAEASALSGRIETLLLPADPRDEKNVIMEIRAGTGGDEAGLFASELFRLYQRYAEAKGFKVDLISSSPTGIGGIKEVIFELRGRGAYSRLKWESGVHRVQRVPATETQGRVHTSTATVAVLPEIDEVEIAVPDSDLRVDVFRSSGPGGQSVNTTDSAVRITHLPTGLVVSSQDEKSQLQNRRKALAVLRARLYELEENRRQAEQSSERRSQVGSGERAEKIRTYNFPQSRVTDHRVDLTSYRIDGIMAGEIDEFIEALGAAERARRLAEMQHG